jgi:pimeloyl-ACP methyl ester carboxylesterase
MRKISLSYRITGYGPPLLLLHGMGVTYFIWKNLEPLLTPYYKLIIVELPGHGCSPALPAGISYYPGSAARLEELRQQLEIDRWSILGYSMGTRVLQEYLRCYPERVSSAFFICPLLAKRTAALLLQGFIGIEPFVPWLSGFLLRGWMLYQLVIQLGFNGCKHPYAVQWMEEISAQPLETLKKLLTDLPAAGRDPFEIIPAIPMLFLWGDRDRIVEKPRFLENCAKLVKGGHAAPMLAAEEIARCILRLD